MNPKLFSCAYCGKKTGKQATEFLKPAPVVLPPLEYAGGMVAGPIEVSTAVSAVLRPMPAQQPVAPGDLDLAAFDADLAAASAQHVARRRWFRGGRPPQ